MKSYWNMDETGIVLDHKHSKSSENTNMINVMAALNADGGKTPPHMIPRCFIIIQ